MVLLLSLQSMSNHHPRVQHRSVIYRASFDCNATSLFIIAQWHSVKTPLLLFSINQRRTRKEALLAVILLNLCVKKAAFGALTLAGSRSSREWLGALSLKQTGGGGDEEWSLMTSWKGPRLRGWRGGSGSQNLCCTEMTAEGPQRKSNF